MLARGSGGPLKAEGCVKKFGEGGITWRANRGRAQPVPRQEDWTHAVEARVEHPGPVRR